MIKLQNNNVAPFFQYDLFDSDVPLEDQMEKRINKTPGRIQEMTASELLSEDDIEQIFYRIEERLRNIDEKTQGPDYEEVHLSSEDVDISIDTPWVKELLPLSVSSKIQETVQNILSLDMREASRKLADFWLDFPKLEEHRHVRPVPTHPLTTETGILTTLGGPYSSENGSIPIQTSRILSEIDMFGARLYVQGFLMYGLAKDWFVQNRVNLTDAPMKCAIVDKLVTLPSRNGNTFPYERHATLDLREGNIGMTDHEGCFSSDSRNTDWEERIEGTRVALLSHPNKLMGKGLWYALVNNVPLKYQPTQKGPRVSERNGEKYIDPKGWRGYRRQYVNLVHTVMTETDKTRLQETIKNNFKERAIWQVMQNSGTGEYVEQFYLMSDLLAGGALMRATGLEYLSYLRSKSTERDPKFGGMTEWETLLGIKNINLYPDDSKDYVPYFENLVIEDRLSHPGRSESDRIQLAVSLLQWYGHARTLKHFGRYLHVGKPISPASAEAYRVLNEANIQQVWDIVHQKQKGLQTKRNVKILTDMYEKNIYSLLEYTVGENTKTKKTVYDLKSDRDSRQYKITRHAALCFNAPLRKLAVILKEQRKREKGRGVHYLELSYLLKNEIFPKKRMPIRVHNLLAESIVFDDLAQECVGVSPETEPLVRQCEKILDTHLSKPETILGSMFRHEVTDKTQAQGLSSISLSKEEDKGTLYADFIHFFLKSVVAVPLEERMAEAVNQAKRLEKDGSFIMSTLDHLVGMEHVSRRRRELEANLEKYLTQAMEQLQYTEAVVDIVTATETGPVKEDEEKVDDDILFGNISF